MSFFRWWCDLSPKQRYLFSSTLIAVSTVVFLVTGLLLRSVLLGWTLGGVLLISTILRIGED